LLFRSFSHYGSQGERSCITVFITASRLHRISHPHRQLPLRKKRRTRLALTSFVMISSIAWRTVIITSSSDVIESPIGWMQDGAILFLSSVVGDARRSNGAPHCLTPHCGTTSPRCFALSADSLLFLSCVFPLRLLRNHAVFFLGILLSTQRQDGNTQCGEPPVS